MLAIYARLSLDRTGAGIQVDRQLRDCNAIAAARWPDEPVEIFVDNDLSAYQKRVRRPEFDRLVAAMKAHQVVAVVAWNLDRLLRQPRQLEDLIDLGTPIVTAQGDLDLTTDDGQLHARILVAVAKKQSDDTARRVRRAAQDRAEAGKFHGGRHVPYGLRKSTEGYGVDLDAAVHIQEVARLVLEGHPLQSILKGDGRGPTSREAWRQILTGPIVRGMNSAGRPATWEPIVDPTTAAALHVALAKKSRRPSVRWPLSPVLRCGVCHGPMVGAQGKRPGVDKYHRHYRCRVSSHVSIDGPDLETYVGAALDASVIVVKPQPLTTEHASERVVALEHLAGEYARGLITRGEWEAARRAITEQRDVEPVHQLGHRVVDHGVVLGSESTLKDDSIERLAGWRRLIAIDHILIDKARAKGVRFDVDRIHITWRE